MDLAVELHCCDVANIADNRQRCFSPCLTRCVLTSSACPLHRCTILEHRTQPTPQSNNQSFVQQTPALGLFVSCPILPSRMSSRFSSSFLRVGLPFLSFMVIGSFGLAKFLDHKIAVIDAKKRGKDLPQKIAKDDANDILQSIQKSILVGEGRLENKPIARPPGL